MAIILSASCRIANGSSLSKVGCSAAFHCHCTFSTPHRPRKGITSTCNRGKSYSHGSLGDRRRGRHTNTVSFSSEPGNQSPTTTWCYNTIAGFNSLMQYIS